MKLTHHNFNNLMLRLIELIGKKMLNANNSKKHNSQIVKESQKNNSQRVKNLIHNKASF